MKVIKTLFVATFALVAAYSVNMVFTPVIVLSVQNNI